MKIFASEELLEGLLVQNRGESATETESINYTFAAFIDALRHIFNKRAPTTKVPDTIIDYNNKLQSNPFNISNAFNKYFANVGVNPISIGLFLHPICTGKERGANMPPYLKIVWQVMEVRFFAC